MRKPFFITLALMIPAIAIAYFHFSQKPAKEEISAKVYEPTPSPAVTVESEMPTPTPFIEAPESPISKVPELLKLDWHDKVGAYAYIRSFAPQIHNGVIEGKFTQRGQRITIRAFPGGNSVAKVVVCGIGRACVTLASGEMMRKARVMIANAGIVQAGDKLYYAVSFEIFTRLPGYEKLGPLPEQRTVFLEVGKAGINSGIVYFPSNDGSWGEKKLTLRK